jgi:hypothetical protein
MSIKCFNKNNWTFWGQNKKKIETRKQTKLFIVITVLMFWHFTGLLYFFFLLSLYKVLNCEGNDWVSMGINLSAVTISTRCRESFRVFLVDPNKCLRLNIVSLLPVKQQFFFKYFTLKKLNHFSFNFFSLGGLMM